jgi:hypothetical protein
LDRLIGSIQNFDDLTCAGTSALDKSVFWMRHGRALLLARRHGTTKRTLRAWAIG